MFSYVEASFRHSTPKSLFQPSYLMFASFAGAFWLMKQDAFQISVSRTFNKFKSCLKRNKIVKNIVYSPCQIYIAYGLSVPPNVSSTYSSYPNGCCIPKAARTHPIITMYFMIWRRGKFASRASTM